MEFDSRTALIVIDVQNDFCPGGALEVSQGDRVIEPINALLELAPIRVLTQDWHPVGHSSFASSHRDKSAFESVAMPYGEQVLWPDHCVQGTPGAQFHPGLAQARADLVIRKGFRQHIDSYSAFYDNDQKTATGLGGYLREREVTHLVMCGLATDFCVAWSALDGRREGFAVTVVESACQAIDLDGSLDAAWQQMTTAGVVRLASAN